MHNSGCKQSGATDEFWVSLSPPPPGSVDESELLTANLGQPNWNPIPTALPSPFNSHIFKTKTQQTKPTNQTHKQKTCNTNRSIIVIQSDGISILQHFAIISVSWNCLSYYRMIWSFWHIPAAYSSCIFQNDTARVKYLLTATSKRTWTYKKSRVISKTK